MKTKRRGWLIEYSQTINGYTILDAYLLPHIDDTISAIAQCNGYSTIDLRSVYHQVGVEERNINLHEYLLA